jgi:sulfur-oxidizing protein SoxX
MATFARREVALALLVAASMTGCATTQPLADGIDDAFAPSGDPVRGREVFASREGGHCVLCHAAPGIEVAGNVGPPLAGVGSRLAASQIRLRVADISRVNPSAAMPSFHRLGNLEHVAPEYRGRPVLTGQQVEDVVAFLASMR